MAVTEWKLDHASREFLVDIFPPRWRELVADHITFDTQASLSDAVPSKPEAARIRHAPDRAGRERLVVSIAGNCNRPDGSIFHIIWSLDSDRGRRAIESNAVLADHGWRPLAVPIAIELTPARL